MLHSAVVCVAPYPRRAPVFVRVEFLLIPPVHEYVSASGVAIPPPLLCSAVESCEEGHVVAVIYRIRGRGVLGFTPGSNPRQDAGQPLIKRRGADLRWAD